MQFWVGPIVGGPFVAVLYEFVFKLPDSAVPTTPRAQPFDATGNAAAALEEVSMLERSISMGGGRGDSADLDGPGRGVVSTTTMLTALPLGAMGRPSMGTIATNSAAAGAASPGGLNNGGGTRDWR